MRDWLQNSRAQESTSSLTRSWRSSRFLRVTPATHRGGTMEPVRTCLGCRQRAPRSSLVRVVARDGRVVVDAAARLPGRGAWVHPARACLETAVSRKAFGRALRASITDLTSVPELTTLEERAERPMDS
ncbi:MAG TPA: YlxR family protein [Pseudolysinimonas sp.]